MAEPYLGEIKLLPYSFAPRGWALCAGQLLAITSNQALFALLGTTYGGDGRTTFALPDLRGRVALHPSPDTPIGARDGHETVTLTQANMPMHNHMVAASTAQSDTPLFAGNTIAAAMNTAVGDVDLYGPAVSLQALDPAVVSATGGSQAHENSQPSLVMNFCIATQGIFPSRN